MSPNRADLNILLHFMTTNRLKLAVHKVYRLAQADEAMRELLDGHATGKIIVSMQ